MSFSFRKFKTAEKDNLHFLSVNKEVQEMHENMKGLAELLKKYTGNPENMDASSRFRERLETSIQTMASDLSEKYPITPGFVVKRLKELLNETR